MLLTRSGTEILGYGLPKPSNPCQLQFAQNQRRRTPGIFAL